VYVEKGIAREGERKRKREKEREKEKERGSAHEIDRHIYHTLYGKKINTPLPHHWAREAPVRFVLVNRLEMSKNENVSLGRITI
jgi:hypothetical protein